MASRKRKRTAKRARTTAAKRRTPTRRQRPKRKPPQGFATWTAYMASIRPSKGGTVAKRRGRKRRAGSVRLPKRSTRRRGASSRMLGGFGSVFSPRNAMAVNMRGLVSAGTQVGAELGIGTIRGKLMPKTNNTSIVAAVVDLALGTVVGMAAQKFMGRQVGQDIVTGVYSATIRRQVRQLGFAGVNATLGDGGGGSRYVKGPNGRWQLASYPGTGDQRALSGYVGTGDQRPIALSGEVESELYGA